MFGTCRFPRVIENTRVLKHAPPLETQIVQLFQLEDYYYIQTSKIMDGVLCNSMKTCDFFLLPSMAYILRKNLIITRGNIIVSIITCVNLALLPQNCIFSECAQTMMFE